MKKSLRKQIKQDELVTGYASLGAWLTAHAADVKTTLIGALVLAAALGGLLYFRGQRSQESQRAMDEALQAFAASVGKSEEGGTFATREDKFKKALAGFDGVVERYGSLPVGQRARYYAALCRVELGEADKAAAALQELADKKAGGPFEAALAQLALARLQRARGAFDQAVARYQALLGAQVVGISRDHVLMSLATALEEAGRVDEAAAAFRRIVEEMPGSPFAGDARTRASYLKPGSLK